MKEGIYVAGAAAGAAIPLILREYVDKSAPSAVTFDWKKPSVYVGLGGGAVMTLAGLFFGYRLPEIVKDIFISAGPAMMVTGAYSAMFPKGTSAARFATPKLSTPIRITATSGSSGGKVY